MRFLTIGATFTLGGIVGAAAMSFMQNNSMRAISASAATAAEHVAALAAAEEGMLLNQYEKLREGADWPDPNSIVTYRAQYKGRQDRAMRDGRNWRVDVYQFPQDVPMRYLLIGLDPDGSGYFQERTLEQVVNSAPMSAG